METAVVQWTGKQQFTAKGPSGHTIALDSDRTANTAPGAMELLLIALGSCTATDVVTILEKKRQKPEFLEVVVSGERAADPPRVWKKLEVVYRFRGNLEDAAIRHAMQLSEDKYCAVSAMLRKTADVTWRYEILPSEG